MPKPLHQISKRTLAYVREQIGQKTGIQLNAKADCQTLSHLIHQETGHSLSESTLYRLFLQHKAEIKPYIHTLDVIASFCGFSRWVDIENKMTTTLTAVIIDDEKPARENLSAILQSYYPEVTLLGMAASVTRGIELIREKRPQLVFLDIEMGRNTGFDLVRKMGKVSFETIFITAYREYAVDAFRINAVDYLLKPIDIDQLGEALERAKTRLTNRH
ncbi:MAG: response regulator [Saprospiraceae bacterium]|nr:response regulator [Saprospiraceae bacterium]